MPDGDEWRDPVLPAQRRLHGRYRLGGGLVGLLIGIGLFSPTIASVSPMLWPPAGPRWFTLVAVVGLSLMLPLMLGAWIGESYGRRLTD